MDTTETGDKPPAQWTTWLVMDLATVASFALSQNASQFDKNNVVYYIPF